MNTTKVEVIGDQDLSSIPISHAVLYFSIQESVGIPRVVLPEEVHDEGFRLWDTALIAQFVGKVPNFSSFKKSINLLWGNGAEPELRFAGKNLFVIVFLNQEDKRSCFGEGAVVCATTDVDGS